MFYSNFFSLQFGSFLSVICFSNYSTFMQIPMSKPSRELRYLSADGSCTLSWHETDKRNMNVHMKFECMHIDVMKREYLTSIFIWYLRTFSKSWFLCLFTRILCHGLSGCAHELCIKCAFYLCSTSNFRSESLIPPGSIPCPLCRHGIVSFVKLPGSSGKEIKLPQSLGLCTPCVLHHREQDISDASSSLDMSKKCAASVSSDIFCPVTCSPFPSVAIPLCICNEGHCQNFDSRGNETQEELSRHSQSTTSEQVQAEGIRLEKTTCSSMFWGRRSCSREHQCNAEISAWTVV